ncbi:MAG: hypothetical protein ACPGXK_09635 [Phycisphaerae bacterium]
METIPTFRAMTRFVIVLALSVLALSVLVTTGCRGKSEAEKSEEAAKGASTTSTHGTHTHADGTTHGSHDHPHEGDHSDHDDHGDHHDHADVALKPVRIGEWDIELSQGHGKVEAGKESHLTVKLPFDDKGETVVRAWIGTGNRLLSIVGKGSYSAAHGDYDIHAEAPDPLPEKVMWWIEIQKPDGTKLVGSTVPNM